MHVPYWNHEPCTNAGVLIFSQYFNILHSCVVLHAYTTSSNPFIHHQNISTTYASVQSLASGACPNWNREPCTNAGVLIFSQYFNILHSCVVLHSYTTSFNLFILHQNISTTYASMQSLTSGACPIETMSHAWAMHKCCCTDIFSVF